MHGIGYPSTNVLLNTFFNGMDAIKFCPSAVRGLHELFGTDLKILSINVRPRDVSESVNVTPESGIPVLKGLGPELALNGQ